MSATIISTDSNIGATVLGSGVGGVSSVVGGVGVGKDVWIGGTVNIRSLTSATSTSNGALHVEGGVGIGGDLYARNIYQNGALVGSGSTPNLIRLSIILLTLTSLI